MKIEIRLKDGRVKWCSIPKGATITAAQLRVLVERAKGDGKWLVDGCLTVD